MTTYMTRRAVFKTACDLTPADRLEAIDSALIISSYLLKVEDEDVWDIVDGEVPNDDEITDWQDYLHALAIYGAVMCYREFQITGQIHTLSGYFAGLQTTLRGRGIHYKRPPWWDDAGVIKMYRLVLYRSNQEHYGPLFRRKS